MPNHLLQTDAEYARLTKSLDGTGMSSMRIKQHINAPRASVYRALLNPRAVAIWKVPTGMTCHVHAFDAREGDPADELKRWYLANRLKAIDLAREARVEIIALLNQPKESATLALPSVDAKLGEVLALIGQPSVDELLAIWKKRNLQMMTLLRSKLAQALLPGTPKGIETETMTHLI